MQLSSLEIKLLKTYDYIIGIDEAGRGPWAGPVAICGFSIHRDIQIFEEINDSKKLSKKKRGVIFNGLKNKFKRNYIVSLKDNIFIDKHGIGKSIEQSIAEIIAFFQKKYSDKKIKFLIDGYFTKNFQTDYELIKKGDSKVYSIATASIIAKETRDELMMDYAKKYPQYCFDKHVGYGTKLHKKMLEKYGPCPIHRKSYKPVNKVIVNC